MFPRTDLAYEANEEHMKNHAPEGKIDGIEVGDEKTQGLIVNRIKITNENGAKTLMRPIGSYITIHSKNYRFDNTAFYNTCRKIADEIRALSGLSDGDSVLVFGLGNREITPDALGHEAVSNILVTKHIKEQLPDVFDERFRSVFAMAPGVYGTTGIESETFIRAICDKLSPKLVIVIDALCAASPERLLKTFQITDTGISPGAGVKNDRAEISEASLGVKVIAIGVPTVIDFSEGQDSQMMVTPKDIDALIRRAGAAVGMGINLSLHKNVSIDEINEYVG